MYNFQTKFSLKGAYSQTGNIMLNGLPKKHSAIYHKKVWWGECVYCDHRETIYMYVHSSGPQRYNHRSWTESIEG